MVCYPQGEVRIVAQTIEGSVVSIDATGNLITDITTAQLQGVPTDETVSVVCDEHETIGIYSHDHDQPEMTFIAMVGSHSDSVSESTLQLVIVGESARIMLGIDVGTKVVVTWT